MTENEIKEVYDGFTNKDMAYSDFRQEVMKLTDPKKMFKEANKIANVRIKKRQIDELVRNN